MGRIILDLALTLDGYISGPNGEIDWLVKHLLTSACCNPGLDGLQNLIYAGSEVNLFEE